MLAEAIYHPAVGQVVTVDVGFVRPDVHLMGDLVQSTEYEIEFQTADMPSLKIGETIDITDPQTLEVATYKVRSNPDGQGDGFFSKVKLTKL